MRGIRIALQVLIIATGIVIARSQIPAYLDTSVCGTRPSTLPQRIVGGTEATAGWPWMGSIRTSLTGTHLCGATLLDEQWVITSKGCVNQGAYVVFGDNVLSTPSSTHVQKEFCGIFVHPVYNVALLKLCSSVTFNDHVAPACLQTTSTEFTDYVTDQGMGTGVCKVLGWGATSSIGGNSIELREADAILGSNCNVGNDNLCAKDPSNPLDYPIGVCPSDLGGPLLCQGMDSKWRLVGLAVSFDVDCAVTITDVALFLRVSQFQQFVIDSVAVDADCAVRGRICDDGRCYSIDGNCNGIFECNEHEDEFNCHPSCKIVGDTTNQQINLADQPEQTITVQSANYPANYDTRIDCFWIFRAPGEGYGIRFRLLAFNTEANDDVVRIGIGNDYKNEDSVEHVLSGAPALQMNIFINSAVAWMSFTSDIFDVDRGFVIRIYLNDIESPVCVNVPADIHLAVQPGISGTSVNFIPPSATDNSGRVTAPQSDYSPGDIFPVGITDVCYNFFDFSINVVTCCFVVTIEAANQTQQPSPIVTVPVTTNPTSVDEEKWTLNHCVYPVV